MKRKSLLLICLGLLAPLSGCDFPLLFSDIENITICDYSDTVGLNTEYEFDGKVIANYYDGTNVDVTNECSYSVLDTSTKGKHDLEINYEFGEITFFETISIDVQTLSRIELSNYSTECKYNAAYNYDGKVYAYYANGKKVDVTNKAEFSYIDTTHLGTYQTLNVSFTQGGVTSTTSASIFVVETLQDLQEISVSPKSVDVIVDSSYDFNGTVTATYADGSNIELSNSRYLVDDSNVDLSIIGTYEAIVSFTHKGVTKTDTQIVNVVPKPAELLSIEAVNYSKSCERYKQYVFDGQVIATYTDGSSKDITSKCAFGQLDTYSTGTKQLSIKYQEGNIIKTLYINIYVGIPLTSISIPEKLNLGINSEVTLTPVFTPANATDKTVYWLTSDSSICTVKNSGVITGVSTGKCTVSVVSVQNDEIRATCEVTVNKVEVASVSLDINSVSLTVGDRQQLTATVYPSNATNKLVHWSSSDEDVATVSEQGLVTAIAPGTTTIKVVSDENSFIYNECIIEVEQEELAAWTFMMYMCGADLEYDTEDGLLGYASNDLLEILSSKIPYETINLEEKINIVIQTGGIDTSGSWAINSSYLDGAAKISSTNTQRWEVRNNKLYLAKTNNTYTLSSRSEFQNFLEWGIDNYKAERYGLILWDHGCGIGGSLFDEASGKYLSNSDIAIAVENTLKGRSFNKLDCIVYDCCLMGFADIASVNARYFKYMIASQEVESALGFGYDEWLSFLKTNPSEISTDELCESIALSYMNEICFGTKNCHNCMSTCSVYDLSKISALTSDFNTFVSQLEINSRNKFNQMCTDVFEKSLPFGKDEDGSLFGACDFADFVTKLGNYYKVDSSNVLSDIENVVIYNYYCSHYDDVKPCGMNAFVAHEFDNKYYPIQVFKSDYSGSYSTAFSNWQAINLAYGIFFDSY